MASRAGAAMCTTCLALRCLARVESLGDRDELTFALEIRGLVRFVACTLAVLYGL